MIETISAVKPVFVFSATFELFEEVDVGCFPELILDFSDLIRTALEKMFNA